MNNTNNDFKIFYQNMSYGILDLMLLKNAELKSVVMGIVNDFLTRSSYYRNIDKEFTILSLMALRYHYILFKKENYEPQFLLAIYYEVVKYFEQIKSTNIKTEAKLHSEICEFNDRFSEAYKKSNEIKELVIKVSVNNLTKLKNNLKYLSNKEHTTANDRDNSKYLVFISHTSLDKPLARSISSGLGKQGIITWLDEKDILPGASIPEEIAKALENCTHFLLIYSNNSKNKSWVKTELNNIIMKKNSSNSKSPLIIPILLDDLKPPMIISDIKGIKMGNDSQDMKELFQLFKSQPRGQSSLIDVFRLSKKFEKLIETIQWCFQADFFLGIDEEYFWIFYEAELFINSFYLKPENSDINNFVFNSVTYFNDETTPSFDETFYTFERSGLLALNILNKYNEVVTKICSL